MKKLGFILIILSLAIIFSACPPLLEDYVGGASGDILKYDDPLDCYKWFEILDKIAKDGKFVTLDLSKCTFKDGNLSGGLIKERAPIDPPPDPTYSTLPIIFDPFPASASGKDFITSIILPEVAQIIRGAKKDSELTDINDEKIENAKKFSAFRSFKNLRSIKADNVTYIGNFAFVDCTGLTDLDFPRVGNTTLGADIDKYSFMGCTGLKEIKFNTAAVIGECAFKGCTSLAKINFPEVITIEKNAFEGCISLVNVFFEKATKICDEAFKGCTGLKKAEFNTSQKRVTGSGVPPLPPLANPDFSLFPDYVIFYPSVFNGCKALEVLNVRNAWNVYFAKDVLANTSSAIDIYLLDVQDVDDDDESFGHPQNAKFLGEDVNNTIKKISIFVPILEHPENTKINGNKGPNNIAIFLKTNYPPGVAVNVYPK